LAWSSPPTVNGSATAGFLNVKDFDAANAASWFSRFYAAAPNNGTPLPDAMYRIGQYFSMLEAVVALALVVRAYEVRSPDVRIPLAARITDNAGLHSCPASGNDRADACRP